MRKSNTSYNETSLSGGAYKKLLADLLSEELVVSQYFADDSSITAVVIETEAGHILHETWTLLHW